MEEMRLFEYLGFREKSEELKRLKLEADLEIAKLEAKASSKEVASKNIGSNTIPYIVVLVAIGVGSSYFLPPESIAAIIGLLSSVIGALILMLRGITTEEAPAQDPNVTIITELIKSNKELSNRILDKQQPEDPVSVDIDEKDVVIKKGSNTIKSKRK